MDHHPLRFHLAVLLIQSSLFLSYYGASWSHFTMDGWIGLIMSVLAYVMFFSLGQSFQTKDNRPAQFPWIRMSIIVLSLIALENAGDVVSKPFRTYTIGLLVALLVACLFYPLGMGQASNTLKNINQPLR